MSVAGATLAVWATAWLSGRAAADDCLDALSVWGERQEVRADPEVAGQLGLPETDDQPVPPVELLASLRAAGARTASLALPAPGDVRGLGGAGPLVAAALDAAEASLFPDISVGIVPNVPADGVLRWTAYRLAGHGRREYVGIGEAEQVLADEIRAGTAALDELGVASERCDAHRALRDRLRRAPKPSWPAGTPGTALRVLQRADEVGVILDLARADDPGGAVSAGASSHRADALRPLDRAVRQARCAAVDEAARSLADPVTR